MGVNRVIFRRTAREYTIGSLLLLAFSAIAFVWQVEANSYWQTVSYDGAYREECQYFWAASCAVSEHGFPGMRIEMLPVLFWGATISLVAGVLLNATHWQAQKVGN